MYVQPAGPTAYFDVDDTLIMWNRPDDTVPDSDKVRVTTRDITDVFTINHHNIDYLKKLSARGHAIVVWSAGGVDWANAVVEALELQDYVGAVLSKPTYFVDDIQNPSHFMGKHQYYALDGSQPFRIEK